jgi:hypothetical protein
MSEVTSRSQYHFIRFDGGYLFAMATSESPGTMQSGLRNLLSSHKYAATPRCKATLLGGCKTTFRLTPARLIAIAA